MYLVFDIGRTSTRMAVSDDGKSLSPAEIIPTLEDFSEAISSFKKTALKLTNGQKIDIAAGGVRALDMKTKDRLINHPVIPLWVGLPLKKELEEALETTVHLENDAAMVGLGEAVFGAGKDYKIVCYITVSTGVGGVRIVNGKIDQNAVGFEPGQQIINIDPPDTLERYISGDAIQKRIGIEPHNLQDEEVWDDVANLLAIGLNNTIVHWSPQIIILGGSVMKSVSLDRVSLYLSEYLSIFGENPPLIPASLGDQGGLYGALSYLSSSNNLS